MANSRLSVTFEELVNKPHDRVAIDLVLSGLRHVEIVECEAVGVIHDNLRLISVSPD